MENHYYNLNYSFRWRFCLPLNSNAGCGLNIGRLLAAAPAVLTSVCSSLLLRKIHPENSLTPRLLYKHLKFILSLCPWSSKWTFLSLPAAKHLYSSFILALQFAYHVCLSVLNSISLAMFNTTCDHKLFYLVWAVLLLRIHFQIQEFFRALDFQIPFVLKFRHEAYRTNQ